MNLKIKEKLFFIFLSYFFAYSIYFGAFEAGSFTRGFIMLIFISASIFFSIRYLYKTLILKKKKEFPVHLLSILLFLTAISLNIFTIYSFNKAMNTTPIPSLNWLSFFNFYAIIIAFCIYVLIHFSILIFYNLKEKTTFKKSIKESFFLISFYLYLILIIVAIGIVFSFIHMMIT